MRVGGVPFDQGKHPQGSLRPTAIVLHRTYGTLNGDGYNGAYVIGKNGRGGVGIGFHFLVGKNEGQWVQFYDTNVKAAHAKGANSWAVGIEFDGVNEGPLTDWQVRAGAWIISCVTEEHQIPRSYYNASRAKVNGVLPHSSVPGSDHTDMVTRADWYRMSEKWNPYIAPVKPATTPPKDIDWGALRKYLAKDLLTNGFGQMPTLKEGNKNLYVVGLQRALNIVSGAGLKEDGLYGATTKKAVENLQHFLKIPADGVFGDKSRFFTTLALQKISKGLL